MYRWTRMLLLAGAVALAAGCAGAAATQPTRATDGPPKGSIGFKKVPRVAQYGGAAWDNVVARIRNTTVDGCLAACAEDEDCSFAFYNARGNLVIGHHHRPPDPSINSAYRECVLFEGRPWWGSAPQSDGYIKVVAGRESARR